eukprot:752720-Hanusia_phi.AAC.3
MLVTRSCMPMPAREKVRGAEEEGRGTDGEEADTQRDVSHLEDDLARTRERRRRSRHAHSKGQHDVDDLSCSRVDPDDRSGEARERQGPVPLGGGEVNQGKRGDVGSQMDACWRLRTRRGRR